MRGLYSATRLVVVLSILTACAKDELPVDPAPRGGTSSYTYELGSAYRNQLWVDLESGDVRESANLMDWDFAARRTADGLRVYLNTARFMSAWKTPFASLEAANDTTGFGAGKRLEIAANFHNETALGSSLQIGDVYLVDFGYSDIGLPLGLRWMQLVSVSETATEWDVRPLNGSSVSRHTVVAEHADGKLSYISFSNDRIPPTEPEAFDLLFTKYTYAFVDPPVPYLVSGVLLNHRNVCCAVVPDRDFNSIALADTAALTLSNQPDIVGYDWKTYSFDDARYTVDASRTYVIKSYSGYYYKLRFTDFYSPQGVVGFPSMEVERL